METLNFNDKNLNREEFIKELRSIATIGNHNTVAILANYRKKESKAKSVFMDDLGNVQPDPSISDFFVKAVFPFGNSDTNDEYFGFIFDEVLEAIDCFLRGTF